MAKIKDKEEGIIKLENSILSFNNLTDELKNDIDIKTAYKESIKKELSEGTNWNVYQVVKKIDTNFQHEIPDILSMAAFKNPKSLKVMNPDVLVKNNEIVKAAFDKYFAVYSELSPKVQSDPEIKKMYNEYKTEFKIKKLGEKEKVIDESFKKIEEKIIEIKNTDEYKGFVKVFTSFKSYSLNNTLMIMNELKHRGITENYVKGEKEWAALGNPVIDKSKAINILAPYVVKVNKEYEDEVKDNNKEDEKSEKSYVINKFVLVKVYSVVDTQNPKFINDEKNKYIAELGETDKTKEYGKIYEVLTNVMEEEFGVEIKEVGEEKLVNGSKGVYYPTTGEIEIKMNASPEQKIKTLIHEVAHHVSLSVLKGTDTKTGEFEKSKEELIAETSAFLVCDKLGLNTSEYSFKYIASYSKDPDDFKEVMNSVKMVYSKIDEKIDEKLEEKLEELNMEVKEKEQEIVNKEIAEIFENELEMEIFEDESGSREEMA